MNKKGTESTRGRRQSAGKPAARTTSTAPLPARGRGDRDLLSRVARLEELCDEVAVDRSFKAELLARTSSVEGALRDLARSLVDRLPSIEKLLESVARSGPSARPELGVENAEAESSPGGDGSTSRHVRSLDELPEVAGSFDVSLAAFERACRVHLLDLQEQPNPDNSLVGVLCSGVRLAREHAELLKTPVSVAGRGERASGSSSPELKVWSELDLTDEELQRLVDYWMPIIFVRPPYKTSDVERMQRLKNFVAAALQAQKQKGVELLEGLRSRIDVAEQKLRTLCTEGREVLMTREQVVAACKNIGVDLSCGACAGLFFTGDPTVGIHSEGCATIFSIPRSASAAKPAIPSEPTPDQLEACALVVSEAAGQRDEFQPDGEAWKIAKAMFVHFAEHYSAATASRQSTTAQTAQTALIIEPLSEAEITDVYMNCRDVRQGIERAVAAQRAKVKIVESVTDEELRQFSTEYFNTREKPGEHSDEQLVRMLRVRFAGRVIGGESEGVKDGVLRDVQHDIVVKSAIPSEPSMSELKLLIRFLACNNLQDPSDSTCRMWLPTAKIAWRWFAEHYSAAPVSQQRATAQAALTVESLSEEEISEVVARFFKGGNLTAFREAIVFASAVQRTKVRATELASVPREPSHAQLDEICTTFGTALNVAEGARRVWDWFVESFGSLPKELPAGRETTPPEQDPPVAGAGEVGGAPAERESEG